MCVRLARKTTENKNKSQRRYQKDLVKYYLLECSLSPEVPSAFPVLAHFSLALSVLLSFGPSFLLPCLLPHPTFLVPFLVLSSLLSPPLPLQVLCPFSSFYLQCNFLSIESRITYILKMLNKRFPPKSTFIPSFNHYRKAG